MTDREGADRQLGMYISIGLVVGAGLGLLVSTFLGGGFTWVAVGAGVGLIVATALALGLDTDQAPPQQ